MSEQQFDVHIEPMEDIPVLLAKLERMNSWFGHLIFVNKLKLPFLCKISKI